MSTLDEVRAIGDALFALVTVNPPTIRWSQLGSPMVTCESMAVGTSTVRDELVVTNANGKSCIAYELLDVVGLIARECSFEANDDGTTDVARVNENSEQMDTDLTALRAWAAALERPAGTLETVQFLNEGALSVVTLSTTVRLGW